MTGISTKQEAFLFKRKHSKNRTKSPESSHFFFLFISLFKIPLPIPIVNTFETDNKSIGSYTLCDKCSNLIITHIHYIYRDWNGEEELFPPKHEECASVI